MSRSAAERISRKVQSGNRTAPTDWDPSLEGEPSELLARLRKIRARSTATTKGRFISASPQADSAKANGRQNGNHHSHPSAKDELFWQDHLLTWTRGSALMRTFSFPSPILQAFWTRFHVSSPDNIQTAPGKMRANQEASPPARALCVFFEQAIHIHFPCLGEQVEMDLPFRFAKAFPAPLGFLVQRQIESEDERIASRLQRPATLSALQQASSNIGYPFPDLSNSTEPNETNSSLLDDTDQASTSQLHEESSRLLPMVFYLSRCFDDLVPVDRFPQLSFASSPSQDPQPMTHGPASPFGEMDENVIFVSTEIDERFPPIVVTVSPRSSVIRVYAFAARPSAFESTATLLSTPRIHSSLSMTSTNSRNNPAGSHDTAAQMEDDHGRLPANATRMFSDTTAINAGPNTSTLGRGLPVNVRRSARIDLERRTSGMASAAMGRDPSGRSRRISAMHTGPSDRRSTGRKDDQASQGRDRTLGNISHTADGLRLQSQAYQHEAMMEELGAAGTSMRINTNQASAARLRRSSQAAARTPYGGPRNSNRASSSTIKARPSMNLSRLDSSIDTGRLTSGLATGATDGIRADPMEVDTGLADDENLDLAHIADLDSFARSFACVCLLDEIKVSGLSLHSDTTNVQVRRAAFDRVDSSAAYLFLSVPSTNQTLCRRVGYQLVGSAGRSRNLPFCKMPNKQQASAVIPCSALLPVQLLFSDSTEVVTMSTDGGLRLHFGPASSNPPSVDLSAFRALVEGRKRLSGAASYSMQAADETLGSKVRLAATTSPHHVEIDLDMRPRCSTTARVLTTLTRALPSQLAAQINSRWVQARFLTGAKVHKYGRLGEDGDWSALAQVLGISQSHSTAGDITSHYSTADGSAAHRLFGDDPLMSGLAALESGSREKPIAQSRGEPESMLDQSETYQVLLTLYLLAEETHLDTSHPSKELGQIVNLSVALAHHHHAYSWVESFCRLFPSDHASINRQAGRSDQAAQRTGAKAPPVDFYQVLLDALSGRVERTFSLESWIGSDSGSPMTLLNDCAAAFPLLNAVLRTFAVFGQAHQSPHHLSTAVIESMLTHGIDRERLRKMPFGVALPLYQAIRSCQIAPPSGRSPDFYRLVQRAELVLNASAQRSSLGTANVRQLPKQLIRTSPEDVSLDAICAQLFSRDFRLRDVVAMLQTDTVNSVYVAEGENQTEAAITEQHNAAVAAINERTKALAAGRAMLFMTSRPFSPTHKWRIPSICLAVKVRPRGTTIEPDTKTEAAGLDWPEFHNGVSSVLELNLSAGVHVDSKWIFAHLGEQVTARHAGFLYGLGLMKQLPALTPVHVFRYLKMRNNLLTIGFLLGMAVSTVGTADPTARHLIGMQLTAFLPPGSAPLNLSTITQTAGLLAMGIVFLGSNHRWTAKRMIDQIGAQESPIPNIQPQHREAYSVSAGLALGLVYLGKGRGDGMKSLPDKRIISRLAYLIKGSSDAVSDGISSVATTRPDDTCKGDIEINLTSAPAALAFGLMYLRSGNKMIADVMSPPRTPRELDLLRPDVLFVHVLARSLILWDSISPSADWLEAVLPVWMQEQVRIGKPLSEAAQLAQINMQAGACFAIGLKFAGSKDQKARECLWEHLNKLERQVRVQTVSFFSKIRKAAVRAALDQVRISLGMVLAGSGDVDLLRHLRRAHGDVDGETCYGSHMATHMALGLLFLGGGRFTLGTSDLSVAALLISFLPPFPRWSGDNRAHLQAFRHLWYLAIEPRLLVATDIDTNQLVSLPVKIPTSEQDSDNARAFTPLLLPNQRMPGPIESATSRYWPASIDSKLIGERATASGSVASTAEASSASSSQILFVKRKTAHLDYLADPHGTRSLSSRALETSPMDVSADATELVGPGRSELREAMRGFAAQGRDRELVRTLCNLAVSSSIDDSNAAEGVEALMRSVVMECLTMDKMYLLPTYTSIVQLEQMGAQDPRAWLKHYRDLCFADDFYRHRYRRLLSEDPDQSLDDQMLLIQTGLLGRLRRQTQQQARSLFEGEVALRDAITDHLMTRTETLAGQSEAGKFWMVLAASEVPNADDVRDLICTIREYIQTPNSDDTPMDDGGRAARLKAGVHMITDAAFGGADRPPWTTYILNHIIDKLIGDQHHS